LGRSHVRGGRCGMLSTTDPNVGIGDGECRKLSRWIGAPVADVVGACCDSCGTVEDSSKEGETEAKESPVAGVTARPKPR